MADAVRLICRDDELHAELATNAKRVALELFDRNLLADQMRNAIAAAAGDKDAADLDAEQREMNQPIARRRKPSYVRTRN